MAEQSSELAVANDEKVPAEIQRKRTFTLHKKRISETMELDFIALFDKDKIEFRKKTAAMLRENPDLFNINEIGTVADEYSHVSLEQWQQFLSGLLKPELSQKIFECIDHDNSNTITQTAITRFLSGRSKVAARQQTIIDEAWLVDKLKDVDIGKIDEKGNNKIDIDSFRNYFGKLRKEIPDDMVETLFQEIDRDKDGLISTFEYFRWKEGAKIQGVLKQYDVPKIRKSTTKLKILSQGSKRGKKMAVHFKGDGDDDDDTADDIDKLQAQIAQLMRENAEKDDMIRDKDIEIMQLKDANEKHTKDMETFQNEKTQSMENIGVLERSLEDEKNKVNGFKSRINELETQLIESEEKAKDKESASEVLKNTGIREYESKMESLEREYKEEMDGNKGLKERLNALELKYEAMRSGESANDDIDDLYQLLKEKNELILKIKHENETEMAMIQKDKDNLYEQLEETYDIVNDELIADRKYNKRAKKKTIENARDLRKKLKKLKSKIDVKDEKIKQYKSQRILSNYEDKMVNEQNQDEDVSNKKKDESEGIFSFRNLLVFLKDF